MRPDAYRLRALFWVGVVGGFFLFLTARELTRPLWE